MSLAYQYDAEGYFAGEVEGHGLLPNNATYTAPKLQESFIPKWNGQGWEQVEDHKGKEGYLEGKPYTIKDYGPPPEGWSDTPPEPSLDTLITAKKAALDTAYDTVLVGLVALDPASDASLSSKRMAMLTASLAVEDPEGFTFLYSKAAEEYAAIKALIEQATTPEELASVAISFTS